MTAQFQFFQSLPHKKADFVKKKPVELGVTSVPLFFADTEVGFLNPQRNLTFPSRASEVPYAWPGYYISLLGYSEI